MLNNRHLPEVSLLTIYNGSTGPSPWIFLYHCLFGFLSPCQSLYRCLWLLLSTSHLFCTLSSHFLCDDNIGIMWDMSKYTYFDGTLLILLKLLVSPLIRLLLYTITVHRDVFTLFSCTCLARSYGPIGTFDFIISLFISIKPWWSLLYFPPLGLWSIFHMRGSDIPCS